MGYFVLEGFDFGVGILLPVLGRDDTGRRVLINTIGPVWDGNEVWLITAGGAMFAAFPEWYATVFSGFYLPLLLILLALIGRGVAFEYRGKRDDPRWRRRWDRAIVAGSLVPAVLWGVAFANIVRGVPVDAAGEYAGTLWTLLNPYALLAGATTLALFTLHGAVFLALKTRARSGTDANRLARRLGPVAARWRGVPRRHRRHQRRHRAGAGAGRSPPRRRWLGALFANRRRREGWAFTGTAIGDRAGGGGAVHRPVPGRPAVHSGPGLQPDHHQRVLHPVHPADHDLGGGGLPAAGDRLPGLELLGVPPPDRHPGHPGGPGRPAAGASGGPGR